MKAVFLLAATESAGFDFLDVTEQRAFGTSICSTTGLRETPAWLRRDVENTDKFRSRCHCRGGDGKIKEDPPVPSGFPPPNPYLTFNTTFDMNH